MKNIRTERTVYAAWDYELEIEHLNEMSEKGWQLIHGGCFHTKYERDESVVYRYQMDHNMKIENRMRYIDTFREQGWEYVNSTFNGWHYFRKVYDPAKPAEEYEIYSDRPSKEEMAGRLGRLMLVLSAAVALMLAASAISMLADPEMARLGIVAEMAAVLALTGSGCVRMNAVGRGEKPKRRFPVALLLVIAIAGFVWFAVFASVKQEIAVQNSSGMVETTFEVKLPDWVNIEAECESALWMQTEIISVDGECVFRDSAAAGEIADQMEHEWNIFLMPGEYSASIQCDSETSVTLEIA